MDHALTLTSGILGSSGRGWYDGDPKGEELPFPHLCMDLKSNSNNSEYLRKGKSSLQIYWSPQRRCPCLNAPFPKQMSRSKEKVMILRDTWPAALAAFASCQRKHSCCSRNDANPKLPLQNGWISESLHHPPEGTSTIHEATRHNWRMKIVDRPLTLCCQKQNDPHWKKIRRPLSSLFTSTPQVSLYPYENCSPLKATGRNETVHCLLGCINPATSQLQSTVRRDKGKKSLCGSAHRGLRLCVHSIFSEY